MEYLCPVCDKPYDGVFCTACTSSAQDLVPLDALTPEEDEIAYLVDLVTNRKIPIVTPICQCGRDESNNIVISGDQSISRNHFTITKDGNKYFVKDENSRHGSFLNGKQLFAVEEVNDGDVLKVGVSLFWFVLEAKGLDSSPAADPSIKENQSGAFPAEAKGAEDSGVKVEARTSIHTGMGTPAMSNEDLSTVTSDNMPVIVADDALADKYRFKTHSFDTGNKQSNFFPKPSKEMKTSAELASATSPTHKNNSQDTAKPNVMDSPKVHDQLPKSEISPASQRDDFAKLAGLQEPEEQPMSAEALIKSLDIDTDKAKSSKEKDTNHPKASRKSGQIGGKSKSGSPHEQPKGMGGFIERLGASVAGNKEASQPKSENKGALLGSLLGSSSGSHAGKLNEQSAKEAPQAQPEVAAAPVLACQLSQAEQAAKEMESLGNNQPARLTESAAVAASELKQLDEQLMSLNEQIKTMKQKFEDISNHVSQLGQMRENLSAKQSLNGEDLTSLCVTVFAEIGFQVSAIEPESGKDRQDLKLDTAETTAIVRMVGPMGDDERTQLRQLAMAQARFWLEGKPEPKGILVISSAEESSGVPSERTFSQDLAKYAMKKDVCLMTTSQLLCIHSSMINNGAQALVVQNQILETSGWLRGFVQELSTNSGDKKSQADRMSYLLSA